MTICNPYKVTKVTWPEEILGIGPVRPDYHHQGFFTLVERKSGFQPVLPNLYGYEQRMTRSANTVRSYLFDLAALHWAADKSGIDLDRRFSQLEPLQKREIDVLCASMTWILGRDVLDKASPATIARRLTTIRAYLDWGSHRYLDTLKVSDTYKVAERKISRMARWISEYAPGSAQIRDSMRSPIALSNEQISVLRFAISPGFPHNPFRSSSRLAEQYRNAAIVLLLIEAGVRPAELCMLELSDCFMESRSLYISKWKADSLTAIDNANETMRVRRKFGRLATAGNTTIKRKSIVGHKTVGRSILLSEIMLEILSEYIDNHRPQILKNLSVKRSPYLFVSTRDGGPLTPSGIRSLVKRIAEYFPELGKLTSYTFRHTSVTVSLAVMRKALKSLPSLMAEQKMREALTYKFGWCLSSDMVEHYGRADLNRLLAELATDQMRTISTFSDVEIEAANDA